MQASRIDWSQLWYPGPRQPFNAEQMARAGSEPPSPTALVLTATTVGAMGLAVLIATPAGQRAPVAWLLGAQLALGAVLARWLWWNPWRRPLLLATLAVMAVMVAAALGVRMMWPDRSQRAAATSLLAIGGGLLPMALWFLVLWRAQQIDGRLREQAERERAIEMARRLAAAQLEPHFLFNTLASLQHWVQTQDERAAPLLDALVGYLRATLPMFDRPLQPAGDELVAVRRYLEVMAARFGSRLRYTLDVPDEVQALPLPPGLLLTLVENAVEHGVEPMLAGGSVAVRGRRDGDDAVIEVQDDGAGPPPDLRDGIGLTNVRERLALAWGGRARLDIGAGADGGCTARVRVAWRATR